MQGLITYDVQQDLNLAKRAFAASNRKFEDMENKAENVLSTCRMTWLRKLHYKYVTTEY